MKNLQALEEYVLGMRSTWKYKCRRSQEGGSLPKYMEVQTSVFAIHGFTEMPHILWVMQVESPW